MYIVCHVVCQPFVVFFNMYHFMCQNNHYLRFIPGKTAIAEGIAQILAAPTMLERLDELFDRNDDGEFIKQKEVARIQELAKLCPQRLRNHRVVSLELANLVAGTKYRGLYILYF